MDRFSQAHTLDVWYYHVEAEAVVEMFDRTSKRGKKRATKMVKKARTKTHHRTMEKLTHFSIRKQIIEEHNMSLAIVLGAFYIAMGLIISAVVG